MTRDSNIFEKVVGALKSARDKRRIDDRPELHDFWRQPAPDGNAPTAYIGQVHRSRALLKLMGDMPRDARILEVGCNVGRNLAFLHDNGYHNVAGVEISPHAVELLRKTYPQLADADIHVGPAEETLVSFEDDSVDMVFTMAVLEHIHPKSTEVFSNIGRIAKSLLTIEPERHASHRQYPHDIRAIFQGLGFHLLNSVSMKDMEDTADDPAISEYFAWHFNKR